MPQQNVLQALRGIMLGAEQYRQALAHHFGLGMTEAQAVSHLTNNGELGQTELASLLGITTGATTALIDRLESAGIAHRTAHPTDRRRTVVTLTEDGLAIVKAGQELMGRIFVGVDKNDLAPVAAVLNKIRENMEEQIRELAEEDSRAAS